MEAFVEMQEPADAHKLVEFYAESPLKMNGVTIKVSFTQIYRTLEHCVTARPYDEKQLQKSEEAEPKKKPEKSRVSTSPAKERRHSRGKSEGKSSARSVRSVSSDRPKRGKSSAPRADSRADSRDDSRDDSRRSREAEAKQTEDTHKAPSQSGEDSDIDGMQVVGAHIDDENPDLPPDLDSCITLDEVSDSEEAEPEAEEDEELDSPRVVYIGNLPLCKFSDPQFIKMVQQVYRPVRYFINRQQRMGLVEFKSRHEARGFVAKMQNHNFGGCSIDVFISNRYNRLPWGRGVEYDEFGRIMRHFRVGNSPKRDDNPFLHSQLDGRRSSHRNPQIEVTHSPQRARRGSRDRSRNEVRSRGRSNGKSRARSRSRNKSRGKSRDRSKDRHSPKSKSPVPQEKPPLNSAASKEDPATAKEDSTAADAKEQGWIIQEEYMGEQEDGEIQHLKIESVVSLHTEGLGEQEQGSMVMGAPESKESEEDGSGTEAAKATKRKGDGDAEAAAEPGLEKRSKQEGEQDSVMTEGGAAEMRVPSKPIGSEFIVFYCSLCHVQCSDEQEARVSHCSSREHYLKYQEVTGKDLKQDCITHNSICS